MEGSVLSPGTLHLRVPKERKRNLLWKRYVLARAAKSVELQRALAVVCGEDVLFYVNTFVFQFNPKKKKGEVGPFVTWDFQEPALIAILGAVEGDRDLFIEKSRDVGVSWLCLIVMDWLCLFFLWKKFLCISHSEVAVDKPGDPDSLFWKVQFMHEHLPDWLVRQKPVHRKLRFSYPATNSSLNGAATSERSGVGGRATAIFLDEFSKQPNAFEIQGQTADVSDCRIFNGTHYGIGTAFYELSQRPDLNKLVLHWSQHPDKNKGLYTAVERRVKLLDSWSGVVYRNKGTHREERYRYPEEYPFVLDGTPSGGPFPGLRSPWYDDETIRRCSSRDVAMHLDINPSGSVSQFFEPLMIRLLTETYCCPAAWEGDVIHDKDTGRFIGLQRRSGGPLRLWINPVGHGVPNGCYKIGGDISTGSGATISCLSIVDAVRGQKVGEYANPRILPADLAPLAVALCRCFDNAELAWETPGPGQTFGNRVVELGYLYIYFRTNELSLLKDRSDTPGWVNTVSNKRDLLEQYRFALDSRLLINRSKEALEECLAFRFTARGGVEHGNEESRNDPTGARVNHGDRVIADALAWKLSMGLQKPPREEVKELSSPLTLGGRYRVWLEQRAGADVY